jgi:alpha-tubulin suppressor-like RCC1 family protein
MAVREDYMKPRKICVWSLTSLALLPACSTEPSTDVGVTVQSDALSAQTINVQLTLPSGLGSAAFLVAQTKVQLDSGVTVNSPIWSAGSVVMQPDAKAQALTVTGNVTLADRDKVDSIVYGGTLTKGNSDVIGSATRTTLSNVVRSTSITFAATTENVTVNSGQTRTLSPGSYVNLNVSSGATLILSAGDYYVSSLKFESSAKVQLSPTAGATRIFVASSLTYRATLANGADASRFLIEYLGTTPLTLQTPFAGSLIVPRTSLTIGPVANQVHSGSFMAQSIEVQPNAKLEFVPFNPAGTTSSCAANTWDPDGNPFTPCVPKTVCAAGSYISSEGSTTSDRVCTGCTSGQFSTVANAPSCTAWTNCAAGTYVSNTPSATTDRICTACPAGKYSSGNNQSQCLSQGTCSAGTVQTAPGTASSPAVCAPCAAGQYCAGGTSPQTTCAAGTWDNDSDPATACVTQSVCVAGTYVASEGTATADRTCAACGSGTYSAANNAAVCLPWIDCTAGSYVTNTPSTTLDRTCGPCPSGQYSSSDNQTSCQPQGTCAAGTVQTAPGTATSPAICAACEPGTYCAGDTTPAAACGPSTWDNDGNPATPCVEKTPCAPGTFVSSEGTTTADRLCAPCEAGQYSTATNAAACTPWSSCSPGTYVSGAPSATADRVCDSCAAGTFTGTSDADSCAAWTNCPPGTYVSNTPSLTVDRICAACPPGQTSTVENAPSCSAAGTAAPTTLSSCYYHSCAVVDGHAYCWGWNGYGQLGNGMTGEFGGVPQQVTGLTSGVTSVFAGFGHSCALVGGAATCWGANNNGQLGDGTTSDRPTPGAVAGLGSEVSSMSAGLFHTCAIINGGAKCWGQNLNGQIGINSASSDPVFAPVQPNGLGSGVTAIAAGGTHTCAVVNGAAYCWGDNQYGQLGDGTFQERWVPMPVPGLGSGVTAIVASLSMTCAVVNGAAQCWGDNLTGSGIGAGVANPSAIPVPVYGLTSGVTEIGVGLYHACAVVYGGLQCWGSNSWGQLGAFAAADNYMPIPITGATSGVANPVAGSDHTCARISGTLMCWGGNPYGQLGDGGTTNSLYPVPVLFPTST